MDPAIDTREIAGEIGERMREELDYEREAKHAALYRDMLADDAGCARAARLARALDRPAADAGLARGRASCWLQGAPISRRATASRVGHVPGLVAAVQPLRRHPRRPASRQLHGLQRQAARPQASTSSTTAASASSRRASSAAWSTSIAGLPQGRSRRASCTPTRPGVSAGCRARTGRDPQHLGALHLCGRCSMTASAPSPTASAGAVRPARGFQRPPGAEGKGAGAGAARIRIHGSRGHRPRRRVPAPRRRAQLPPAVRGGDRRFLDSAVEQRQAEALAAVGLVATD